MKRQLNIGLSLKVFILLGMELSYVYALTLFTAYQSYMPPERELKL